MLVTAHPVIQTEFFDFVWFTSGVCVFSFVFSTVGTAVVSTLEVRPQVWMEATAWQPTLVGMSRGQGVMRVGLSLMG